MFPINHTSESVHNPTMDLNAHQHNPYSRRVDSLPPIWKNSLDRGIHLRLYRNGDGHYPGKTVTLNKKQFRTFESWLSELSNNMRLRNGAIWRVYTPTNGTRKDDFDDLHEGQCLVVAGQERFKPLRYDQISSSEKKKSLPFKYDASPVSHSRQFQCSGKIKHIDVSSILIKVWANGHDLQGPKRVVIPPRIQNILPEILKAVDEVLREECVGTVEKLFFHSGIKVTHPDQIYKNGEYVACTKTQRFQKMNYSEYGTKNITSPRLPQRKFLPPIGVRSNNSTQQSSPEHSVSSKNSQANGYGHRRRVANRREEDQVFPARPVKHTRSGGEKQVDLDQDEGGMFKAKQQNRNTRGAREVQDSRNMRTDLPVDQREAKEVEEEVINGRRDDPRNNRYANGRPQQAPPPRGGGGGGAMAKPNSKRPPAPAQQKERPPSRNRDLELRRNQSATKIQANYRGYRARKHIDHNRQQKQKQKQQNGFDDRNDRRDSRNEYDRRRSAHESPRPQTPETFTGYAEEQAAVKIQSAYRGHRTRSDMKRQKQQQKRQRTPRESPRRRERTPTPREVTPRAITPETTNLLDLEEKAATKIQAGFRGYTTRRDLARQRHDEAREDLQSARDELNQLRDDVDDEWRREEEAATKIQAGFRGHKVRQQYSRQSQNARRSQTPQQIAQENSYDSLYRENEAATKIQSRYRGYKARKQYLTRPAAAN